MAVQFRGMGCVTGVVLSVILLLVVVAVLRGCATPTW